MPAATLCDARPALTSPPQRLVVAETDALWTLCTPLGPRLALLQIRDLEEWERLATAIPALGEPPDLRRGMLVGLVCRVGTPANGQWPVHIEGIQNQGGDGIVEASFAGGSYLPDGIGLLEIVHVGGIRRVLAVDVDGVIFQTGQ